MTLIWYRMVKSSIHLSFAHEEEFSIRTLLTIAPDTCMYRKRYMQNNILGSRKDTDVQIVAMTGFVSRPPFRYRHSLVIVLMHCHK
jgi:hypothetical protein